MLFQVFLSQRNIKRKCIVNCLRKLCNQDFEIRKCLYYPLHTFIMINPLDGLFCTVINTGLQDLHIKDDLCLSDYHLFNNIGQQADA